MCCQNFKTNITTQTNLRGLCLFMTVWQITSASWFRNFLETEIVVQILNPHYSQDLSDYSFFWFPLLKEISPDVAMMLKLLLPVPFFNIYRVCPNIYYTAYRD